MKISVIMKAVRGWGEDWTRDWTCFGLTGFGFWTFEKGLDLGMFRIGFVGILGKTGKKFELIFFYWRIVLYKGLFGNNPHNP